MTNKIGKYLREPTAAAVVVFVAAALYFSFGVSSFGPFDYDEAIYTETAREMQSHSGTYILPTYNYEGFYEKPPLLYWAIILVDKIFPHHNDISRSARFLQSLVAALTALFVYLFAFYISKSIKTAIISAVVFATSSGECVLSRAILTDGIFTMFVTGAVFAGFAAIESGGKKFSLIFWASSALAVLAKGPAGFILSAGSVILGGTILYRRKVLGFLKIFLTPSGIIIFLMLSLPWYVAAYIKSGGAAVRNFLFIHNIKRFASVPFEGHSGPIFYYLPVIAVWFFPWVVFLVPAIKQILKEENSDRRKFLIYSLGGAIFPLIVFSLSKTKLPNYIAPLFPFLAVAVGYFISEKFIVLDKIMGLTGKIFSAIMVSLPGLALAVVFGIAPLWLNRNIDRFAEVMPFIDDGKRAIHFGFSFPAISLLAIILTVCGIITLFVSSERFKKSALILTIFAALITGFLIPLAAKDVWDLIQKPIEEISSEAGRLTQGKDEAIIFAYKLMMNPSIVLYSGKRVNFISENERELIAEAARDGKKVYVISVKKKFLSDIAPMGFNIIKESGGYVLAAWRK